MKIFYLYTALTTRGGADRVIANKANYLVKHGYDVYIITDSQIGKPAAFPLSEKIRFIDLDIDFNKEYGHNLIIRTFIYHKLMNLYKNRLIKLIDKEQPEIIITTMGRELDVVSNLRKKIIKIGEAHTTKKHLRNFHLIEKKNIIFKALVRFWRYKQEKNANKLDALVVLTNEDADNWNKKIDKTYVINNSLSFYPNESSTCENKQAIMVGRYNDAKGYEYLIEAWNQVFKKHKDWKLQVFGSGEYKDIVRKTIFEKKLQNTIIMNEPTEFIKDRYLESSIYIMSSRYEGFPMVLLEAMACGVPCVSFDCPYGPRNIIKNGEDGILVDYLNTQDLAKNICKLIENDSLRKQMGVNAKRNIMRFSEEKIMKQWINLFNELKIKSNHEYN